MQDVGPPARSLTAMAFDSVRGRTVLFGGTATAGPLGDTWEWDGSDWTQIQDVGPSARSGHAMAFDSDQQRTLLFGGLASGGMIGDTWQWDGTAWTQVEDTGPPVRELHGMVYATNRKRTVVFGGEDGSGTTLSDTWEWDSTHWTHEQDIGPARQGLSIAFMGSSTALFGGLNGATAESAMVAGDTWEWDGSHWVEVQDMGPQARWLHAMVFDSARNRLVLVGGTTTLARDTALGDTWEATVPDSAPSPGPDSGQLVLAAFSAQYGPTTGLTGKLTLSAPAPASGVFVQLSVDNAAVTGLVFDSGQSSGLPGFLVPPWVVPFPGGIETITFRGNASEIGLGLLKFTATFGGVTKTASVDTSIHP
jgi:hypothetical protein